MTDPYAQARNIVLNMIETPLASKEQLREAITATVELLRRRQPEVTVDEERLYRDLEAAVDVYQPESISLENNAGHLPWLTPDRIKSTDWNFWGRYLRYQREKERLPPLVLERLHSSTLSVLSKLEDPRRPGPWDRRGMVVGQIQSGKTGHYIGLMSRGADAGYDLSGVLAGMN